MDEVKLQVLKEARAELIKICTKLAEHDVQASVSRAIALIDSVIRAVELEDKMKFHEKIPRF